jgi:hypothetical protein
MIRSLTRATIGAFAIALVATAAHAQSGATDARNVRVGVESHTSAKFMGAKANTGTVTHSAMNGKHVLTLSADFVTPDTPDPHWQVVDARGNVYLLQRIPIKDDKMNRSITLPGYIADIAKVQIYCAWAEAVLGETTFGSATLRLSN